MDWSTSLQRALDYIEDHLTEPLDAETVGRQAACSGFYFQRIFGVLCGMTLGEYIRARRLTQAGSELAAGRLRVIDAALKYGYESPESFTRAFVRFHGVPPSQVRRDGAQLRALSPLSVQIILKGGHYMDYRIEEKGPLHFLERVEHHTIEDAAGVNTIPDFWTRAASDGTIRTLMDLCGGPIYGVCYGNQPTDSKSFDYAIAAAWRPGCPVPDGFRVSDLPARTWAVFPCRGPLPDAITQTWHTLCAEFFPTAEYLPTYEWDVEVYRSADTQRMDYACELWVPVVKKG